VIDVAGGPADKVGEYSSLEVEGGPDYSDMSQHISYYDRTNQQLKYCWGTGAFWSCGVVDTDGDVGRYSSLEVASSLPQIAYQHLISGTSAELKYARYNGSVWYTGKVDGPDLDMGGFSSLDLCTRTKPEIPHIGYRRDGRLGYAYLQLGPMAPHWEVSTADYLPSSGIALALDDNCRPHMSYYETKMGGLRYYRATAGDPQFEAVDAGGSLDPSATTSLALDGLGRPHISFYADSTYGDLRYAHKVLGVFLPLIVR
jgi:hypothetical protein